jgi:CRP-like cAMP-binding protein
MTLLENHPEKNIIRAQLRQNILLKDLSESERAELETHLVIVDGNKGDFLLHQGVREMEQYFILDGILKRVVSNPEGKEMILRFADAHDMETSYAALRLGRHPETKELFEYCVMRGMSEIMAHTITLHLLDAPGRVHRFMRKHPELEDRIPSKELASYLNLSAETLSRLRKRGKI